MEVRNGRGAVQTFVVGYEIMSPLICLVDDDPEICDLIRITLETRNYTVLEAHEGEEGLDLVQHCEPDLILLDLKMPGMNGFELLNRIRMLPSHAHVPVIIMTSLTTDSERSEDDWKDRIGVSDFISKPFEPMDLIRRVEKVLTAENKKPVA
jgi:CheY-like chemotaxis protein